MVYSLDATVKVKMFGHVSQKHGRWHNGAKSPDSTVLYCTDGEINMDIGGKIFHAEEGDLLLIPRDTLFKPLDGGKCKYYFFNFEAEVLPETRELPNYIAIVPHAGLKDGHAYSSVGKYDSESRAEQYMKNAPYRIKEIFEQADKLHPEKSFSDQLLLDNLLRELLIRMGMDKPSKINARLKEILEYIHNNYFEHISLSSLSERFLMSESYIARLFKKELGCKPSEYINRIRISVAKTLLSETDISITEISEKTGFSDVYYFSKTFKRIEGVSPSQLR